MLPLDHPDRIQITFDDHRLVANAGLILPTTLARHLGLPQLVQECHDLGDAPGRANTGDKMHDPGCVCAGWRRLHRRRRRVAHRRDSSGSGLSRSRRHPPWGPSCAASDGATSANWTG